MKIVLLLCILDAIMSYLIILGSNQSDPEEYINSKEKSLADSNKEDDLNA